MNGRLILLADTDSWWGGGGGPTKHKADEIEIETYSNIFATQLPTNPIEILLRP